MMNSTENILVIAAEECAEIQQAITKSLRFGLDNHYEENTTNAMQIVTEYYQLQAMIEELQKRMVLPYLTHEAIFDVKKSKIDKVKYYNEESKRCKRLND